jgi:hypothetical protein|tara:strand:- start:86 stop:283 length:198 start_codon:yes stop_codon:yes gene_type:complete
MTLLSVIDSLLSMPDRKYIDVLDYWTAYNIEVHFRELVKETQEADFTGMTENSKTEETDTYTPLN